MMNKLAKYLLAALFVPAVVLTACVRDGQKDCNSYVTFYYLTLDGDRAFPQSIETIDLYMFDKEGLFVDKVSVAPSAAAQRYMLPEGLERVKQIVAWADTDDNVDVADMQKGVSKIADLTMAVKPALETTLDTEFSQMWHGELLTGVDIRYREEQHVIELKKITNTFRVVINVTEDGDPVDGEEFEYAITARNGSYDYQANPSGDLITYEPYMTQPGAAGSGNTVAELSVLRLMAPSAASPADESRITITSPANGDEVVFDQSLAGFLDMYRLARYGSLTLQQFLDREHDYVLMIYLKKGPATGSDTYFSVNVMLNDWVVRDPQDVDE